MVESRIDSESEARADAEEPPARRTCMLWGLPLAAMTYREVLDEVVRLIERRRPSFFVTANMNYAMLSSRLPELAEVNRKADFMVSDGVPFLWISSWKEAKLPERVAGSDLIFDLCGLAAEKGYKVFLVGGPPGLAEKAAANLTERYPGLKVVGAVSPPFREMTDDERAELASEIHRASPDLLFAAMTQPKGELLVARNYETWNVPVCIQVGMALDLAAGRLQRAPRLIQRLGLEMPYRMAQEPRRLFGRYSRNALFMFKMLARDLCSGIASKGRRLIGASSAEQGNGKIG